MTLRQLWIRLTSTRYTRALEAEVLLLRAENKALLNSILGIAGVPPIPALPGEFPEAETSAEPAGENGGEFAMTPAGSVSRSARIMKSNMGVAAGNSRGGKLAMPMRRRSWQQINRMLEFESGLKKREA